MSMDQDGAIGGAPAYPANDDLRESVARRHGGGRSLGRASVLPFVCFVLITANGLYMLLVAFGNITDYSTNQAFVQHVLAMDTTNFGAAPGTGLDSQVMWRSITSPELHTAAYVGVIVWEMLTGIVLAVAVVLWFRGRTFDLTRSLATLGLGMILVLFFGGFIVVGGEWFQMWRSTAWNGLDPAFRNSVLALLTLVLLHLPSATSAQWSR